MWYVLFLLVLVSTRDLFPWPWIATLVAMMFLVGVAVVGHKDNPR
jgi:hypothetical protein